MNLIDLPWISSELRSPGDTVGNGTVVSPPGEKLRGRAMEGWLDMAVMKITMTIYYEIYYIIG